jgi:hypothetical protein
MTTFNDLTDDVFEAIKTYLGDGVASGAWTACPISYPNDGFQPPADGSPFVKFEIAGSLYSQQSIGETTQALNRWDETGRVWLHVLVKSGDGGSTARGAAKALAVLFRGKTLLNGTLEFLDASIGEGAAGDEDGNWFRVSVDIRWRLIED